MDILSRYRSYQQFDSPTNMAHPQPDREPLLRRLPPPIQVPPMLIQPGVEKLESPASIPEDSDFPPTKFTQYRYDARKRRMPQCIAHRGYKAKFPENTMGAFKGAVKVGAHAIETDIHLTKDDVVVISHGATLKRCYGRPEKIIDCTWDQIKDLKTEREPHEHMPRLKDVLEYLAQPGLEEIWLLLDIKLDNDATTVMSLIGSTISSVSAPAKKAWHERVVLGIWAAKYLPLCVQYLPGFPVMHIGFSAPYARHFLTVPNVGFNMLLPTLVAPGGRKFLRDVRAKHRQVLAWTVNTEERMEWCIRRKLDGVITDDPKLFLEVCEKHDESKREALMPISFKAMMDILWIWSFIRIMTFFYRKRLAPVASQDLIRRRPAFQDMKN